MILVPLRRNIKFTESHFQIIFIFEILEITRRNNFDVLLILAAQINVLI
jgi:hypothetical protein